MSTLFKLMNARNDRIFSCKISCIFHHIIIFSMLTEITPWQPARMLSRSGVINYCYFLLTPSSFHILAEVMFHFSLLMSQKLTTKIHFRCGKWEWGKVQLWHELNDQWRRKIFSSSSHTKYLQHVHSHVSPSIDDDRDTTDDKTRNQTSQLKLRREMKIASRVFDISERTKWGRIFWSHTHRFILLWLSTSSSL